MTESILDTTKTSLGLAADYDVFDAELIIHINSILAVLTDLGIGPDTGFSIAGPTETWDQFLIRPDELTVDPRLNHVKSYVGLRVKMIFDPPTLGYLITSYEKLIDELTWRIMVVQDNVLNPLPPPEVITGSDTLIFDGGAP